MKVTVTVSRKQIAAIRSFLKGRVTGAVIHRDDIDVCADVLLAILAKTPNEKKQ